jgi:hypothetical protein
MGQNEEGQVIIEYILMLLLVVSVVTILTFGFRKTIFGLWIGLSRDVAGACPQRSCNKDTTNIR